MHYCTNEAYTIVGIWCVGRKAIEKILMSFRKTYVILVVARKMKWIDWRVQIGTQ